MDVQQYLPAEYTELLEEEDEIVFLERVTNLMNVRTETELPLNNYINI